MEHRCRKVVYDEEMRPWPCGYCDWCVRTQEGHLRDDLQFHPKEVKALKDRGWKRVNDPRTAKR